MKKFIYFTTFLLVVLASVAFFKVNGGNSVEAMEQKEDIMYMVSHSEYWSGEEGQVITRLLDFRGDPITANYCRAYITYPNKTRFVDGALMSSSILDASYYYSFIVPETEGVYEYKTLCNYNTPLSNRNRTAMKSFHVSPALNFQKVLNDTIVLGHEELAENLTSIKDDTDYIRNNLPGIGENTSSFQTSVLEALGNLQNMCDNNATSGSSLCQWVNETNDRVQSVENQITVGFTNIENNITYYYNATIESIEDLDEKIEQYHNETLDIILDIQDDVNQTHEHVHLILEQLNISTDFININAWSTGDCIISSNWQLFAQVRNEINQILTDSEIYCEATTNFWGGPVNMTWDVLDLRFKYLHECDTPGSINWGVECLPI